MSRKINSYQLVLGFIFCTLSAHFGAAQVKRKPELPTKSVSRAEVLLLGTFHFQDAGADDYKPKFSVDVLSASRQKEIAALLDELARFKPTKIAVEWAAEKQPELDERYRKYLAGQFELRADEIDQLGFRLAKRLGHQQLFAVDGRSRRYDANTSTESLVQRAQQNKQFDLLERGQQWYAYYNNLSEYEDQLKTQMTIPDFLAHLNSPEKLKLTLNQYLVGEIAVGGNGDYSGADMRTAWYNRNLRIFSNIERIPLKTDERILVIIGQGHVPILRHFVENTLEYSLAETGKYIKPSRKAKL